MVLAARGAREVEGGTEPIGDAALVDALKRKARTVYVKTAVAAVATAAVTYLVCFR